MLYPIATVSYPLTLTLGLPFNAPFLYSMQYYQYIDQYIQISMLVPYAVPLGYTIRLSFVNAYIRVGTASTSFQSATYIPLYNYLSSQFDLIISNMGPIQAATTVTFVVMIYIATTQQFQLKAYIDTTSTISIFASSSYLYQGLTQSSGIATSNVLNNIYDNRFGWGERVMSASTFISNQWIYVVVGQLIAVDATSSGSYIEIIFPPTIQVSTSFNQSQDCLISANTNSCVVTFSRTSTYLRVTIQGTTTYLASNPNLFPYNTYIYIYLKNILFPKASTIQTIYPIYFTLFKSNVVNPTAYYYVRNINAMPYWNGLSGLSLTYLNNYYTSTPSQYQTYSGVLRLQSTTPSQLTLTVQPNEQFVIMFYAMYGFRSITTIKNMDSYPCTSNINIKCQYFLGRTGINQLYNFDQILVTFTNTSYFTSNFHILLPDMQSGQYNNYFYYQVGTQNLVTQDFTFLYSGYYYRQWNYWNSALSTYAQLYVDITGKAGSYRTNVSVYVYDTGSSVGALSYCILMT